MNNKFNNIDPKILDAARRGDANSVLQNINATDRQKIQEVLSDKDKLKQILSSDAAQKLMKILGGNKNG